MNVLVAILASETAAPQTATLLDTLWDAINTPLFRAVALGAVAVWLMLPGGRRLSRRLGAVLGLVSLGTFGWLLPRFGFWAEDTVFLALAAVTVIAAAATVTTRSPVYSAIWFAMVLLGTAGLFLYQGAQFLGVATVVVYAGAILVTFLFVLMLAQPEGHAYYDRISWEAMLSAATGAIMVGMLTMAVFAAFDRPEPKAGVAAAPEAATTSAQEDARRKNILAADHVAHLGGEMFSRHLIAVEAAGALLLAALVGAVAIVAQGKRIPPVELPREQHGSGAHGE